MISLKINAYLRKIKLLVGLRNYDVIGVEKSVYSNYKKFSF